MSQAEVAKKLKLSQSAVSKIERITMALKLSDLLRYVKTLDEKLPLQLELPLGETIIIQFCNSHSRASWH